MNLRTLIVKTLYPMCSDEVQILIDQMQSNPSKFAEMFEDYRPTHPWAKALGRDNFELIDHVALRQQLRLLRGVLAKQLILEGLLSFNANTETMDDLIKRFETTELSKPMNRAQRDLAKKFEKYEKAQQSKEWTI